MHWWQGECGLLTLVDIKSAQYPPLPFETQVTGMELSAFADRSVKERVAWSLDPAYKGETLLSWHNTVGMDGRRYF